MLKKILITGPESSGKSTLAAQLAEQAHALWIPEYARAYLQALDRPYCELDLVYILAGQLRWQNGHTQLSPYFERARRSHPPSSARTRGASPVLICDTGPETIWVWSKVKYGRVAEAIQQAFTETHYTHCLLCAPDLPWEADPLRETPDPATRWQLFEQYECLLQRQGWSYDIIQGERDIRFSQAWEAISPYL